jgi:hypothetical protein
MGHHSADNAVPRTPDPPLVDDVLAEMSVGRCYVVADLVAAFEELDPARNTIRNRLETLVERERVERVKHVSGLVTYRRLE